MPHRLPPDPPVGARPRLGRGVEGACPPAGGPRRAAAGLARREAVDVARAHLEADRPRPRERLGGFPRVLPDHGGVDRIRLLPSAGRRPGRADRRREDRPGRTASGVGDDRFVPSGPRLQRPPRLRARRLRPGPGVGLPGSLPGRHRGHGTADHPAVPAEPRAGRGLRGRTPADRTRIARRGPAAPGQRGHTARSGPGRPGRPIGRRRASGGRARRGGGGLGRHAPRPGRAAPAHAPGEGTGRRHLGDGGGRADLRERALRRPRPPRSRRRGEPPLRRQRVPGERVPARRGLLGPSVLRLRRRPPLRRHERRRRGRRGPARRDRDRGDGEPHQAHGRADEPGQPSGRPTRLRASCPAPLAAEEDRASGRGHPPLAAARPERGGE